MLRNEPMVLTPPLANRAFVIVDRPLTVYEPGRSASPSTKMRIERRSPIVTTACVPIICSFTRCSMRALSSSKRMPATATGPSSGKLIRPSRFTVSE